MGGPVRRTASQEGAGMGETSKESTAPAASMHAEYIKATAEIARLRRELAEAEAGRDAILAQWLTGKPVEAAAPARVAPVVVQSAYERFLARVKELAPPFCCADVFELMGTPPRTLTRWLRQAEADGHVRRVARDRYQLVQS